MSESNGHIQVPSSNGTSGYSAAVRLLLRRDGRDIPLSQVGGGRLYFQTPTQLTDGPAELIVEVDGNARRKAIWLSAPAAPADYAEYRAA